MVKIYVCVCVYIYPRYSIQALDVITLIIITRNQEISIEIKQEITRESDHLRQLEVHKNALRSRTWTLPHFTV